MRIADSNVSMGAAYSTNELFTSSTTRAVGNADGSLTALDHTAVMLSISTGGGSAYRSGDGRGDGRGEGHGEGRGENSRDDYGWNSRLKRNETVDARRQRQRAGNAAYVSAPAETYESSRLTEAMDKHTLRLEMLKRIIFMLTGKRPQMMTPSMTKDFAARNSGKTDNSSSVVSGSSGLSGGTRTVVTETDSTYMREDKMNFALSAQIKTADGVKIDVGINLSMSKSFMEQNYSRTIAEEELCDPLVFNFDGLGVQLTDRTFSFDLDNDGVEDQVSQLASGNGFLALDLNGDGTINNGGELFGTESGNGFTDLAAYDADGNGWIDENDDIFHKLRIFTIDEDGNQQLIGLGEKGIGAIFLGNVQSDFDLRNDENQLQGQISHTGFYLNEDYTAGLVQNVNFNLYNDTLAHNKAAIEELTAERVLDFAL